MQNYGIVFEKYSIKNTKNITMTIFKAIIAFFHFLDFVLEVPENPKKNLTPSANEAVKSEIFDL